MRPIPVRPDNSWRYDHILKVHSDISDEMLARNADPGLYRHPAGEVARPATADELRRDGIPQLK